jgi:hypothetical protein
MRIQQRMYSTKGCGGEYVDVGDTGTEKIGQQGSSLFIPFSGLH